MTWTVTLTVVDCAAMSTPLSGAKIQRELTDLGVTDASGEFVATLDDMDTIVIFKISKADYVSANLAANKDADAGKVKTKCLNNPSSIPDGHDPDVPGESGGTPIGSGGCFIVSAATGSSASAEVVSLRLLRDRVCAASRIGAALVDAVYDEYRLFSPGIADGLQQDEFARRVALEVVVRPLLAWYACAGTLGLGDPDEEAACAAAQDVADACERHEAGVALLGLLDAVRAQVTLPPEAPAGVVELASRLADFPFAAWAILDPLVRAWRSTIDHLDVVDEVAEWLVTAPFEALDQPVSTDALGAELAVLDDFLAFRPSMRDQLGDRLQAAWPDAGHALNKAGPERKPPNTIRTR